MLTLGYKASAEQFAPRPLLDFVVEAERCGFESAFISDHFQPWRHTGGHAPFSLAWMAAAGERTERIIIGTSVLTPSFRYHPAIVAQAIGTLGALYPNRIVLGVGTGESLNEVPSTGMAWPGFKEREGRLREAVELMRRLWTEDRVTHHGEYFRTERATIYDRPERPVPIYLSAAGPKAAFTAGELGDGFICTSGKSPALYTETLLPNVERGRAAAGRTADPYDMMIEIKLSFDTDRQHALEATRHWAALALSPEEKTGVEDPLEMERLADALPLERAASRWIVSDDPAEVVERLRPYVEYGFRHLVFHAPGPDQSRFLNLFAERVAPALRAAFTA
ncbi:MAG TPA: glucose-6-phosphate dehydrogenase (coenzyme-F420) [Stellaceae bacterium]|nr:glucose-6-phosphate dehydrogenase (coenzyme-F420) [Stellaceae bacterium]